MYTFFKELFLKEFVFSKYNPSFLNRCNKIGKLKSSKISPNNWIHFLEKGHETNIMSP